LKFSLPIPNLTLTTPQVMDPKEIYAIAIAVLTYVSLLLLFYLIYFLLKITLGAQYATVIYLPAQLAFLVLIPAYVLSKVYFDHFKR